MGKRDQEKRNEDEAPKSLVEPGAPLFVEAECVNCGGTIYRYRWETRDADWLHVSTHRNSCTRTTRARAA